MSKVRREKHKNLVFRSQVNKQLNRDVKLYNYAPRWRQWEKAEYERIYKK